MTHDEIEIALARISALFSDDVVQRFREEIDKGAQSISINISNNIDTGRFVEFVVDGVVKELSYGRSGGARTHLVPSR